MKTLTDALGLTQAEPIATKLARLKDGAETAHIIAVQKADEALLGVQATVKAGADAELAAITETLKSAARRAEALANSGVLDRDQDSRASELAAAGELAS